jgi:hypothetical protein
MGEFALIHFVDNFHPTIMISLVYLFHNNRFGYTPLEEARAMANDKIINVLETFQSNHVQAKVADSEPELQATVVQLSERVQYLESLLTEVSKIGGALKNQTASSGGDPNVIRLAEKLASIQASENE